MVRFFKFIYPYVKRQKERFLAINLLIFLSAYAQTQVPLSIRTSIDRFISTNRADLLYIGFFTILGFGTLDWLSGMALRAINNRYSQKIQFDIRQDVFNKLQSLDLEFYSKESIGQIMARSIQEVYALQQILGWGYRIMLLTISLFVGAVISLLLVSLTLALIFLAVVPLILAVLIYSTKRNAEKFYRAQYEFGRVSEVLAENFAGIKTVKSFGREFDEIERFNKVNQDFLDASMEVVKVRATLQPGMIFLLSLALVTLLFVGGGFATLGIIDTGSFVAFMLLALQIMVPGRFLGDLAIQLQTANTSARRLEEVLKAEKTLKELPDAQDIDPEDASIRFEEVYFKYPKSRDYVLKNISLEIKEGERVALIGPTGSGKSTLVNLIPRFFDPQKGRVLIGNKDIRNYTLKSVRDLVGIVHQDNFLFTLSIRDNIAFGKKDASFEEIVAAAKLAEAHDFIMEFPDGYDTIVGERGVTLSGGQRQRLAIARVLLANPPIIVFDDSVSAVDPETEAVLQRNISEQLGTKTMIIISQRPSSLKYVNRILVLDHGKIIQDGTHSQLISRPGLYREFIAAVESQVEDLVLIEDNEKEQIESLRKAVSILKERDQAATEKEDRK
ncbi:MAG: ABC transporter ATP-binding protein [Methanobacteriota archaeon]|nr:MAG: ABC transporter ATP-binding protein [Euryarchaeota archaeon]